MGRRPQVVLFGTYDTDAHPRVRVIAEGLRAHGISVRQVNVPAGVPTADRVAAVRGWRAGAGATTRLVRPWPALARSARSAGVRRPDAVIVGYLGVLDVHLARLLWPRVPLILDHLAPVAGTLADRGLVPTDDAGGAPAGRGAGSEPSTAQSVIARLASAADRAATAGTTWVLCDTEAMRDQLPPSARSRALVVPVGADHRWFAARRDADRPAPLRVVHFGGFAPLHGVDVLARALAARPGLPIDVTLIGDGQEHAAIRTLLAGDPRVRWLPWLPADDLPAVVAGHDLGIGILGTTPRARAVVPTKVFQYAAAGLAVMTSDTAPQRAVLDGAAAFVPAGDPAATAAALADLAADPHAVARLVRAAAGHADTAFTPEAVTAGLADLVRHLAAP